MARTTSLTWGQYADFCREWSRQLLVNPRHWRIEGRPVCAINNLSDFVSRYGHITFAVMIRYLVKVVEHELSLTPYVLGVIGSVNSRNLRLANSLPVDGITGYGLLPNWLGDSIQSYAQLIEQRTRDWEAMQQRLRVPFYPVVCTGWDASVRGKFRNELRPEYGYPYSPIVTGNTAELFGHFIDKALAFNERWQPRENLVFLHAWNEWTEASVLEPSDRFGTTLLDEVRKRAVGLKCYSEVQASAIHV
jgi:hypothetical protein